MAWEFLSGGPVKRSNIMTGAKWRQRCAKLLGGPVHEPLGGQSGCPLQRHVQVSQRPELGEVDGGIEVPLGTLVPFFLKGNWGRLLDSQDDDSAGALDEG